MPRPISPQIKRSAELIGAHCVSWRKLHGLTTQQLAERVGVSRSTLRRIEVGDPGVSFEVFLNTCRALGILDQVIEATDPYNTDLGRARADEQLPQRVRS